MAKPSHDPASSLNLLALELWGLGDLALAMPFLREAVRHAHVTLIAKPHAAPLLARFAPEVELVSFTAPWTAFTGKYRLHRWPWRELMDVLRLARRRRFDLGVSARADPRDHALLWLGNVAHRIGFSRAGSGALLSQQLARPTEPHRAQHWREIAVACGWPMPSFGPLESPAAANSRRIVIHPGAGQPVRRWPIERFLEIADRLRLDGWRVELLDDTSLTLEQLLPALANASRFIGNDSGPGHIAALLGVPTFTLFSSSSPTLFSPIHPRAGWIEGAPCPYRPCSDACRFPEPHCIRSLSVDAVWTRLQSWLNAT